MEGNLDLPKLIPSTEMEKKDDQFEEFIETLPKQKSLGGYLIAQYNGFWFDVNELLGTLTFRENFQSNDSDIILATFPKSGTTWLKALTFSIVNRKKHSLSESPLLSSNPHQLVPFVEIYLYKDGKIPDISSVPSPRIFATHIPCQCLPNAILDGSNCKIIYLCRNPLDIITSTRHFGVQNGFSLEGDLSMSVEGIVESFSEGTVYYGPFWDHILGYWEASLKNPEKVLFLKYEDLVKDINSCVKKMAEFLGCAFSAEEENEGLVEEITKLCRMENLKNLECNKKGEAEAAFNAKNSSFFRKGEVGDWVNFVPPSMAERIENLMKEKLWKSGLTLDIHG